MGTSKPWQPLLTALGILLSGGSAGAQPVFTSHFSLEARIAEAEVVVRARVAEIKRIEVVPPGGRNKQGILEPDGIYDRAIILTVDEVLKGKAGKRIDDMRVMEAFYFHPRYEEWLKAGTSLLWFLQKGPGSPDRWARHVIRLSGRVVGGQDREEPAFSSNLMILRDAKDILDRD